MKYRGRLSQPDEFENLVVRSLPNGEVLRLKEVADIELGDEAYNYNVTLNGHPVAMSIIYQTSGSNASQTINEIDRVLEELSAGLAAGMEFVTLNDTNRFLYASIHEVVETLHSLLFCSWSLWCISFCRICVPRLFPRLPYSFPL